MPRLYERILPCGCLALASVALQVLNSLFDSCNSARFLSLRTYTADIPPFLHILHMELVDALCHIRIVVCGGRRSVVAFLFCVASNALDSPSNDEAMDRLFQWHYTTRYLLSEHTVLLPRPRRKVNSWVKKIKARLPRQVIVSPHVLPLSVYNQFAILKNDHEQSPLKSWSNIIAPPARSTEPVALSPLPSAIPLQR